MNCLCNHTPFEIDSCPRMLLTEGVRCTGASCDMCRRTYWDVFHSALFQLERQEALQDAGMIVAGRLPDDACQGEALELVQPTGTPTTPIQSFTDTDWEGRAADYVGKRLEEAFDYIDFLTEICFDADDQLVNPVMLEQVGRQRAAILRHALEWLKATHPQ